MSLRRVEHVETKGSSYEELEAVGEAMGFGAQRGLKTVFKLDGALCSVALEINSGSVVGSLFAVAFEGPQAPAGPTMVLRRETPTDLEDKNKFVSVEVQTGDPDFDLEVYIDSTAAEPEVRRFLARPEVRRAARWMIDRGIQTLVIDRDGVKGKTSHRPAWFKDEMVQLFDSLRELARGGALRGEVLKPRGGVVLPLSVISAVIGAFFCFGTLGAIEGLQFFALVAGVVTGLVGYAVTKPLAEQWVAGHSSSGGRARLIAASLGLTIGCFTVFGVAHLLAKKVTE